MTYIELINEFWRQNRLNPFSDREIGFYFYLLSQCNIREWVNPFELQSRIIELERLYSRKMIVEVRNKLKQRGLIDFVAKNNTATLYTIVGVDNIPTKASLNVSLMEQSQEHLQEHLQGHSKEHSGNIYKDIRLKTKSILDDNNNKSSSRACTQEEIHLEQFDALLQEIYSGNHQIWEDQMRKKHGIDSVREYLPSFRDHAIAASRVDSIMCVKDLTRYFNNAFRYFSKTSEIELFTQYWSDAQSEDYKTYCQWLAGKCNNVMRMIYPLSEVEFHELKKAYGSNFIMDTILRLDNRPDLLTKYFSLYRTIINWHDYGN